MGTVPMLYSWEECEECHMLGLGLGSYVSLSQSAYQAGRGNMLLSSQYSEVT